MNGRPGAELFGTKSETLNRLNQTKTWFNIPPSFTFLVSDWDLDCGAILAKIHNTFRSDALLAIRSSAVEEDLENSSMAGRYSSYLNVSAKVEELKKAIGNIISEYNPSPLNQVLVQEMVKDISCSGVAMTRDVDDGAPYFVISYDDESGNTDTITGGKGVHKTVYIYNNAPLNNVKSLRLRQCLRLGKTLSKYYGNTPLDIEFAIGKDLSAHLLQVRRIATSDKWKPNIENKIQKTLSKVNRSLRDTFRPRANLSGDTTILTNMSDWNPAEMIGKHPRPLAISLYQDLITDQVWHETRAILGYRKIGNIPLMTVVEGCPFVDVRASLNSFLPSKTEKQTGSSLVNAALERLSARPELHDRLEFELAFTVLDFNFHQEYSKRYSGVLSSDKFETFKNQLKILTRNLLKTGDTGTLHWSEQKLFGLHTRQLEKYDRKPRGVCKTASIPVLLDECRKNGTFPFAIMARHAFIAEILLRSAVQRGAMSVERVASFKRSVPTIATECDQLLRAVQNGDQDISVFKRLFGHLRPGTYDIRSARYADRPALLQFQPGARSQQTEVFEASDEEKRSLTLLFQESGLGKRAASYFFDYSRRAIAGREFGKFVFTRNLSDILEAISHLGEGVGLDRDVLSYLRIEQLCALLGKGTGRIDSAQLKDIVTRGRENWENHADIKLGYIIRSLEDIQVVPLHRAAANFVTKRLVFAPISILDRHSLPSEDLSKNIVCIENADPGFDWIFSCGIAGLITQYGGANSHMAVRCAEFALPAAIGCGELTFEELKKAKFVELDCENHSVRPLNAR